MKWLVDREALIEALQNITHTDTCAWVRANEARREGGPSCAPCCDCGLDEVYRLLAPEDHVDVRGGRGGAIEIRDYLTQCFATDQDGSFLRAFVNESIRMAFSDPRLIEIVSKHMWGEAFTKPHEDLRREAAKVALGLAADAICGRPKTIDYSQVFSVDGDNVCFPVDLLRRFSCVPMTSQDAERIENSSLIDWGGGRIALCRLDMTKPIDREAWRAYGWTVVGDDPKDPK